LSFHYRDVRVGDLPCPGLSGFLEDKWQGYIERLNTLEHGPGHFDGYCERRRLVEQIAKEIRPALIERLRQDPLSQPDTHRLEKMVDAKLDSEQ